MPTSLTDNAVRQAIADAQIAAQEHRTKTVQVGAQKKTIRSPHPSPVDWRDRWIYFLMLDRFNNPARAPLHPWNQRCGVHQGGTFKGVQTQLAYLEELGVQALWISPILKNPPPDGNYHGYGAQDFLNLDARFASDGTQATAERELTELVDEAHARGMHVILDIVLNHAGRVFDYVTGSGTTGSFADAGVLNGPLGSEPAIRWLDSTGNPRPQWQNNLTAPAPQADDAVWPTDLQNYTFFRRRGSKITDTPDARGYVPGDFETLRQLVAEYDATVPGLETMRAQYGPAPVLNILIRSYAYLMGRYDLDGYRIDTVKYVHPKIIETFGNAMREYAMSIGKANFFTFGEVYDNEQTIAAFVGRNGGSGDGFGIDAALDFPLFYKLPPISKGFMDVAALRQVYKDRKAQEKELLSSHGDAGLYFVTFPDNHDQKQRFKHPATPVEQVKIGMTLLFTLPGIPAVYYGTEQMLEGTVFANGQPDLDQIDWSVREALWGKPNAFSNTSPMFREIQNLARLRNNEAALRYGRLYFREVSGNGTDFGHSSGPGGIVAYSRILGDREMVIVANTGAQSFSGRVLVDFDLTAGVQGMNVAYSNTGTTGTSAVQTIDATIWRDGQPNPCRIATVAVNLAAREVQILAPLAAGATRTMTAKK